MQAKLVRRYEGGGGRSGRGWGEGGCSAGLVILVDAVIEYIY